MRINGPEHSPSPAGRSLVPVNHRDTPRGAVVHHARPAAPFVAQLVATAQDAPQTRLRRRGSANHAAALYAAAASIARPSAIKISL
jgi:hypothetical protein